MRQANTPRRLNANEVKISRKNREFVFPVTDGSAKLSGRDYEFQEPGIYPKRLNANEVLISRKDGEFLFLVADGSAKLSGREYEFQETTLRQESSVRRERESLSGESHCDREQVST